MGPAPRIDRVRFRNKVRDPSPFTFPTVAESFAAPRANSPESVGY